MRLDMMRLDEALEASARGAEWERVPRATPRPIGELDDSRKFVPGRAKLLIRATSAPNADPSDLDRETSGSAETWPAPAMPEEEIASAAEE